MEEQVADADAQQVVNLLVGQIPLVGALKPPERLFDVLAADHGAVSVDHADAVLLREIFVDRRFGRFAGPDRKHKRTGQLTRGFVLPSHRGIGVLTVREQADGWTNLCLVLGKHEHNDSEQRNPGASTAQGRRPDKGIERQGAGRRDQRRHQDKDFSGLSNHRIRRDQGPDHAQR